MQLLVPAQLTLCRLLDEPSNSTTLDAAVGEQSDEAVELQNRKLKCRKVP